jgi:hypothetical protein
MNITTERFPRQSRDRGAATSGPVWSESHYTRGERVAMVVCVLATLFVIGLLIVENGSPLR